MRVLFPASGRNVAGVALLLIRVITGIIMTVHGWQKLTQIGPANFGQQAFANLGVPLPVFLGYVVTLTEFLGGILLIIGLLSRLAALALTIEMVFTILLVKTHVGFISSAGGAGAEFDLALMAGFLAILLIGPGGLALDHVLGFEGPVAQGEAPRRRRRRIF
jgi:putative oxidoreductase